MNPSARHQGIHHNVMTGAIWAASVALAAGALWLVIYMWMVLVTLD